VGGREGRRQRDRGPPPPGRANQRRRRGGGHRSSRNGESERCGSVSTISAGTWKGRVRRRFWHRQCPGRGAPGCRVDRYGS
jgi:hypothetical protein